MKFAHDINRFLKIHPFRGSGILRKVITSLIPTPIGPTVVCTNYGFDIVVDPIVDKGLERSIYYTGTYEAGTLDIITKCLRKGDSFIDIGCNIGLMSLLASKLIGINGTVYSFEPEPKIFSIFQKNIELNKLNNIYVYNIALGSNNYNATIYSNLNASRGSASLIKSHEVNSEGVVVSTQTLDEFITKNNISNIRMVKIDVEGWEMEVLKGGKRFFSGSDAPIICIEYSNLHPIKNDQFGIIDIYRFFQNINNYIIYKSEKGKEEISRLVRITDSTDLPYHDNLYCFLPMHLNSLTQDIFV